jgi:hypothetical protein
MISRFDLQLAFANSIDGPLTHSPKPKEGSSATAADLSSTHTNPAAATCTRSTRSDPHAYAWTCSSAALNQPGLPRRCQRTLTNGRADGASRQVSRILYDIIMCSLMRAAKIRIGHYNASSLTARLRISRTPLIHRICKKIM